MDGYEAVRKTSGWRDRSEEGRLRVTGSDRAAWLQGLLTNDVAALAPGGGCYAAYLTAQGRMIADVRVLAVSALPADHPTADPTADRDAADRPRPDRAPLDRSLSDHLLLDVPAAQRSVVFDRLSMFIITEDAAIEDVTETLARVSLHGPASATILTAILDVDADGDTAARPGANLAVLAEHANVRARFRGHAILIAGARDLGVDGFDVYLPIAAKADLIAAATAEGASPIGEDAWHTSRVEAGRPLFGVDMTTETIPLEAGIEERAISFTKGCYVGQEIIIRVVHRGGGRVARKLVGLRPIAPIAAQMPIVSGDRSIGQVTSAAWSPRIGQWIAMGYVHRDFAEPGTTVTIGGAPDPVAATVVALPHVDAAVAVPS